MTGSRRLAGRDPRLLAVLALLVLARCGELQPALPAATDLGACEDGLDNDGDGRADYPLDPGCESSDDPAEDDPVLARACSDGVDNDGDGLVDFDADGDGVRDPGEDPGCDSAADDDESNLRLPQCADGVDNDGDILVDLDDPNCQGRNDDGEAPECRDGVDNDNDGATDAPADTECQSSEDDSESIL